MTGKSLYLVNPATSVPGYFGADVAAAKGLAPMVGIADLAIATVAALAPADWQVRLCDEHISPADDMPGEAVVGLTGKVTQAPRLMELAQRYRAAGKLVLIGGPFASLEPERVRDLADVLVIGEIEALATQLFDELGRGVWQAQYRADKPDLGRLVMPRWDLYPHQRALIGCVQTSRGCPFECEFCDVIAYLGRKQRHKPVAHVIAELQQLYELGFRSVFLADDNFTAYRRRTRELLEALQAWNAGLPDGSMHLSTQVSIDAARDEDLIAQAAQAGIDWVFIGLETPNEDSLRECKKPQNLATDMAQGVSAFLRHGIAVTAGMMVGFDHDGPDIFERQLGFAQSLPVPIFSLGAVAAPAATPLYRRIQLAGRLRESHPAVAGSPWETNIRPLRMSQDCLSQGLQTLARTIYAPPYFAARLRALASKIAPHPLHARQGTRPRPVDADAMFVIKHLANAGPPEMDLVRQALALSAKFAHASPAIMTALFRYAQALHVLHWR